MMMPAASFSSSSSSSGSATVRVEKATSEFLMGPDWTMNIDICDTINSNPWLAKDVVKAVKKRLQHKNPKVHLLALTLLETMVKNCGEHVHFQIAERNVLPEMIKIVKKKTDMRVRDKILVLIDSWQEAFGGRGGKYPQYYFAYEELRHSGVEFPRRTPEAAPIFTPPVTHPTVRQAQAGYGMPSNSSTRLDEAMASEIENLSLSGIESMRNTLDLLSDMLQAVDPKDHMALKDEVIVDLVDRCRSNQKKLMQMLTTTGDEELLGQGLELNDSLQNVLAKHDAIASGSPLPTQVRSSISRPTDMHVPHSKPTEVREVSPKSIVTPSAPVTPVSREQAEDEEEEEDDFAQLARRHSRTSSNISQSGSMGPGGGGLTGNITDNVTASSDPSLSMALVPSGPPPPASTTKAQDMIDFLSITLSTDAASPNLPQTPTASSYNIDQTPISSTNTSYPHVSQPYAGNQGQAQSQGQAQGQGQVPFNSYIVPWAQSQPQLQPQPQPQGQPRPQPQPQPAQSQPPQLSSAYPPPPWASTPGYYNNPYPSSSTPYTYLTPQPTSYIPSQSVRPLQHVNPYPARGLNGAAINGDIRPVSNSTPTFSAVPAGAGQKPFIPSYRLFEDLNVLGNPDGRFRTSDTSSRLPGPTSGQSMVGGKK